MVVIKQANGFTLVEVLAALFAGALLLTSIGWVISGLSRDLRISETNETSKEILFATLALDKIVAQSRFIDKENRHLSRSEDSINFRIFAREASGQKGYFPARLYVLESINGASLMFDYSGYDIPATQLIHDAHTIVFEYQETLDNEKLVSLESISIIIEQNSSADPYIINMRPRIHEVGSL